MKSDHAAYERAKRELEQAKEPADNRSRRCLRRQRSGFQHSCPRHVTGVVLEVPPSRLFSDSGANTFNDGTTIAKVADMTDLIFNGKVDETEVDLLREGMEVRITVGAIPDSDYPAVIEKISADGDRRQRHQHFPKEAALNLNAETKLRAGYSANANMILRARRTPLAVPESVVEYDGDKAYVYVLKDSVPTQKFERKNSRPACQMVFLCRLNPVTSTLRLLSEAVLLRNKNMKTLYKTLIALTLISADC